MASASFSTTPAPFLLLRISIQGVVFGAGNSHHCSLIPLSKASIDRGYGRCIVYRKEGDIFRKDDRAHPPPANPETGTGQWAAVVILIFRTPLGNEPVNGIARATLTS
jgi:hypothetical protein